MQCYAMVAFIGIVIYNYYLTSPSNVSFDMGQGVISLLGLYVLCFLLSE